MKGLIAILFATGILLSNVCPTQIAVAISTTGHGDSSRPIAMSPMDANSCQNTESHHAQWDTSGNFSCSEGHCVTTADPQISGFAAAGQEVTTGGVFIAGDSSAPSIIHATPFAIASEERPPPLHFITTIILRV